MNGNRIGNFIKAKRKELNLTVEEFAAAVGAPAFLVLKWEEGVPPEIDYLLPISTVLKVETKELLRGVETEPEQFETVDIVSTADTQQAAATLPETKKKEKGYYEQLREKISATDYSNYECFEPTGLNGFGDTERKFGYVICSIMLALVLLINAINLISWLSRPRALTVENCKEYLQFEVVAMNYTNNTEYEVRLTRKPKSYDVANLRVTVEITFELLPIFDEYKEEKTIIREASFSDDLLLSGETLKAYITVSHIGYDERKIKVVYAEGEM